MKVTVPVIIDIKLPDDLSDPAVGDPLEDRMKRAAAKDRYDLATNPLNLDAALLVFGVQIEINSLAGSFPATYTAGEMLAADGTVSQRFWSEWKAENDGYGLMRGEMSFKSQITAGGIRPAKLADGRWTLAVNGTPILA